ncbi:barstar family protein [Pelistega europaea]|uniref:Barstar (barnase inhibitor) domain-containing protein n=1 Tax=Pelistega europaea TaxID=106147 RepID=A0A7Y4P4A5_9BURK|nr:barstar family protein [Pelistega europaea]NOL49887.1 hypothetical protein [Pelistega europaea]
MSVKVCELVKVESMSQFYQHMVHSLNLPQYMAHNLDALFDSLSADVEGPIFIYWPNHQVAFQQLGEDKVQRIINVFRDLQRMRPDFFVYLD